MDTLRSRTLMLRADPFARQVAVGFSYWFVFLVALNPSDLFQALDDGLTPAWRAEALRILLASSLGALSAPIVWTLVRRFPVEGAFVRRHAVVLALSSVAIAFVLIAVSCLLAPLMGIGDTRPVWTALPQHLAANWMLLSFCIAAFVGLVHVWRPRATQERPQRASLFVSAVPVKARGRVGIVEMADVDWIETQGNYLALHAGAASHLIRETSVAFEARLDPARFVRIHRRTIVAIERVRELAPLANGDAVVRLNDGRELRVSRGYRAAVRRLLEARAG